MKFKGGLALLLGILTCRCAGAVAPPEVTIQFVGTDKPTSFPKLLRIHVSNPAYTPLNLAKAMASSQLMVDGKLSKRVATFRGPAGLPAVSEWDGCLALEEYAPPLTPGKHRVILTLGGAQSNEVPVRWASAVNWRQGDMKSRTKEIKDLAAALQEGLPRDCVERWLTVIDGGLQETDKVRYFLEPEFKVVVPYRQTYVSSGLRSIVDDAVKVYKEAAALD